MLPRTSAPLTGRQMTFSVQPRPKLVVPARVSVRELPVKIDGDETEALAVIEAAVIVQTRVFVSEP